MITFVEEAWELAVWRISRISSRCGEERRRQAAHDHPGVHGGGRPDPDAADALLRGRGPGAVPGGAAAICLHPTTNVKNRLTNFTLFCARVIDGEQPLDALGRDLATNLGGTNGCDMAWDDKVCRVDVDPRGYGGSDDDDDHYKADRLEHFRGVVQQKKRSLNPAWLRFTLL